MKLVALDTLHFYVQASKLSILSTMDWNQITNFSSLYSTKTTILIEKYENKPKMFRFQMLWFVPTLVFCGFRTRAVKRSGTNFVSVEILMLQLI